MNRGFLNPRTLSLKWLEHQATELRVALSLREEPFPPSPTARFKGDVYLELVVVETLMSEESNPFEVYLIESDDYWYVGCTTRTTPVRFAQHLVPSSDAPIGKLAKQGVEFSWSVLEEGEGTYADRIQAEQRWFEEKIATETRRCLNRLPPAGKMTWLEGAELLLSTEFGQALLRAKLIDGAGTLLKRSRSASATR